MSRQLQLLIAARSAAEHFGSACMQFRHPCCWRFFSLYTCRDYRLARLVVEQRKTRASTSATRCKIGWAWRKWTCLPRAQSVRYTMNNGNLTQFPTQSGTQNEREDRQNGK